MLSLYILISRVKGYVKGPPINADQLGGGVLYPSGGGNVSVRGGTE